MGDSTVLSKQVHTVYAMPEACCPRTWEQSWICVLCGPLQPTVTQKWTIEGTTDNFKVKMADHSMYLYWSTGENTFRVSSSHSSLFRFSDVPTWVSRHTLQHQCMQRTLFAPTPMYLCAYIHTTPVHAAYTVCIYSDVPVCVQYTQHQCMQHTLFAPTPMYLCAYIHTTPVHAAYTVCTYSDVPVCVHTHNTSACSVHCLHLLRCTCAYAYIHTATHIQCVSHKLYCMGANVHGNLFLRIS